MFITGLYTLLIVISPQAFDVKQTCDVSRVTDMVSERQCHDVQYKNKLEYLCKHANKSPLNTCWVEFNDNLEENY